MSITITVGQLANQVRVSVTPHASGVPSGYLEILTQDLAAATLMVERRAPEAPDVAQN